MNLGHLLAKKIKLSKIIHTSRLGFAQELLNNPLKQEVVLIKGILWIQLASISQRIYRYTPFWRGFLVTGLLVKPFLT